MREAGERLDIYVQHGLHPRPLTFFKKTVVAEAGIIDEQCHALAARLEVSEERVRLGFVGQVRRVAADRQSGTVEFRFQRLQAILPAGDQNQTARVRRKLSRKLQADSRRSAGNESGAAVEEFHCRSGNGNPMAGK